jgi:hypothetical protein
MWHLILSWYGRENVLLYEHVLFKGLFEITFEKPKNVFNAQKIGQKKKVLVW